MFYFTEEFKNMTSTKWGSKEDGNTEGDGKRDYRD